MICVFRTSDTTLFNFDCIYTFLKPDTRSEHPDCNVCHKRESHIHDIHIYILPHTDTHTRAHTYSLSNVTHMKIHLRNRPRMNVHTDSSRFYLARLVSLFIDLGIREALLLFYLILSCHIRIGFSCGTFKSLSCTQPALTFTRSYLPDSYRISRNRSVRVPQGGEEGGEKGKRGRDCAGVSVQFLLPARISSKRT